MIRVADKILATHLEVALATAAPSLLGGLSDGDRRRRHAALGEIARHLVERLRCFDIRCGDAAMTSEAQWSLFPQDLGQVGIQGPVQEPA